MFNRFENPWESAAGDGAWSPVGFARPESEFDELLSAWLRERQDCIEHRLYLDDAGKLLREILHEACLSHPLRRRVRHFLQAVRDIQDCDRGSQYERD